MPERMTGDDFRVDGKTLTELLADFERKRTHGMTELQAKIVLAIQENQKLKDALVKACRHCGGVIERAQSFEGLICLKCGRSHFKN